MIINLNITSITGVIATSVANNTSPLVADADITSIGMTAFMKKLPNVTLIEDQIISHYEQ